MEKIFKLLILFLITYAGNLHGQASSYSFSASSGTYVENSVAATLLPLVRADTYISPNQNIGFNFVYEGVTYTTFKMSSNGFISLNSTGGSSLTTNDFSTANAATRPIIAPLWDDLDGATPASSVAGYEVTGVSPNRVLTIEWRNWEWQWDSNTPVISFQVKLYEGSNNIQFVYRQEATAVSFGSASIGIGSATGSGSGSYLNLNNSSASPVASSTSATTNISSKPATGQIYTFTPPVACMGTPEAGTISGSLIRPTCGGSTPTPTTATATGFSTGVSSLAFQWETSLNNMTWSNASGASATTATYTIPAHTAGQIEYYRLKLTCTPSGLFDVSDAVLQVTDPAVPLTQASNVSTSALALTTATITWTAGSGTRRYVVLNTVNSFTDPVGTADVTGISTVYAGGEQKIYDGTGASVSVTGLTQGTTYFVRVYEYLRCTGTPNTNYYNITTATNNPGSFTTATPPPNDVCSGAVIIPPSGPFPFLTSIVNNVGATDAGDPTNTCQANSHAGIWYSFTPTLTGVYSLSLCQSDAPGSAISDNVLSVFTSASGCAGPFIEVACDDDLCVTLANQAYLTTTLTAGTTYYILPYGYNANRGNIQLYINVVIPPANDDCVNALNLTPTPGIYTNPGTQTSTNATLSPQIAACYPLESPNMDIWYKLTTDSDGIPNELIKITVTPLNSQDFDLMLYTGSCGALTEVACAATISTEPEVLTYNEIGFTGDDIEIRDNTTYYLRVVDYDATGGNFTISATGSFALPVNILSFDAKALNNKTVKLTWNVAEEVDVKEYTIERSNDNRIWSAIGTVSASHKSTYDFNDNSPLSGTNYYRLAVKDLNASVAFSDIRTVNFSGRGNMALYPNPANDVLFVSGSDDKNVVVSIYNEVGQIVNTISSNSDTIRTSGIDVSKLTPGAYSIQVKGESGLTTMRFLKQ